MPTLSVLSAADAEVFVASSVAAFIDDLVESGAGRGAATSATDDYMRRLLPDGIRTDGHQFRSVQNEGREVGRLWFGPVPESPGDWYLFEIDIDEEERGHGIGRAALQEVISELDRAAVDRLGLNVLEYNSAALALYESFGFKTGTDSTGGREMWLELRASG